MDTGDIVICLGIFLLISFLGVIVWKAADEPPRNTTVSHTSEYVHEDDDSILGYGANGKIGIKLGDSPLQIDLGSGEVGLSLFDL